MKLKCIYLFSLIFVLNSCKNDTDKRQIETKKDTQKKELVFSIIDKAWVFNAKPINETSRATTLVWNEWRLFLTELDQKPKKTTGAFQKKSTEITKKAMGLQDNIPLQFAKPQIKARISTLITKVQMLDLYIHLSAIPEQKVIALIPEINAQLVALQNQMDKIVQKSNIPLEEGESDLIKMMDSARAIPNIP